MFPTKITIIQEKQSPSISVGSRGKKSRKGFGEKREAKKLPAALMEVGGGKKAIVLFWRSLNGQ